MRQQTYMAIDQTIPEERQRLSRAIATLEQQLSDLGQALMTLKRDIESGQTEGLFGVETLVLEIRQWLEIALELEMQLGKFNTTDRRGGGVSAIDLDKARSDIGCRLDRLRRARCPGRFPA